MQRFSAYLVKTLFLKAPIERVRAYLTEPEKLGEWFHKGKQEFTVGGPWAVLGESENEVCYGEVLDMQFSPGNEKALLIHTFTHPYLEDTPTKCQWVLRSVDEGTILTLTHSGFEAYPGGAFDMTANHDSGWDGHFAKLRNAIAG